MAKPLLFFLNPSGTTGDQKPLSILAVLAARHASTPVTLLYFQEQRKVIQFLPKLARNWIGENWRDKLRLKMFYTRTQLEIFVRGEKEKAIPSALTSFFTIEMRTFGLTFPSTPPTVSAMVLDFGDNEGSNRFTSQLLPRFDQQPCQFFGPVLLSTNVRYSSKRSFEPLEYFCKQQRLQGRKIMALAGSMQIPFPAEDIVSWIEEEEEGSEEETEEEEKTRGKKDKKPLPWSFVLLNVTANFFKDIPIQYQDLFFWADYIEFEDVARVVDFFVTNCGAGSVTAAMAAGCPQVCQTTGLVDGGVGSDKKANEKVISRDLVLGPIGWIPRLSGKHRSTLQIGILALMEDLKQNSEVYQRNAQKVSLFVKKEQEEMFRKTGAFFSTLSTSLEMQTMLNVHREEGHSHIPPIFALSSCESLNFSHLLHLEERRAIGSWSREADANAPVKKSKS